MVENLEYAIAVAKLVGELAFLYGIVVIGISFLVFFIGAAVGLTISFFKDTL